MAIFLYRLGRSSFRRRRLVVVVWLLLLAALGAGAAAYSSAASTSITIPGTESQRALNTLATEFPQASGATGTIVLAAPKGQQLTSGPARQAVLAVTAEAAHLPGVIGAVDPYQARALTPDGRYALITVQFKSPASDVTAAQRAAYDRVGAGAEKLGIRVAHGGEVTAAEPAVGSTEAIGVVVAAVVLVVTFGSLVAAGMTLLTALIGVMVGMAGLFAASSLFQMTTTAPILALMLGLAVGIDYSLFITSRHRQHVLEGMDDEEAAARAVGTAGSAVVFAGATVVIALAGLSVVGIPFLTTMGLAAAGTVAVAVLVALTLQPALLGFAGDRVLPRRLRGSRDESKLAAVVAGKVDEPEAFGFRWGRLITRHRIAVLVVGVLGLLALALPATGMRLALPDSSTAPHGTSARAAADLTAEGFGPGFNGRLILAVSADTRQHTAQVATEAAARIQKLAGVVGVAPAMPNAAGTTAVVAVIPNSAPTDRATEALVHSIRDSVKSLNTGGNQVLLTGVTAVGIDVSEKLSSALPVYLLLVVGLSVVLLMLVFRSILVPIKAALGFLLTFAATFGITVAVFQWGWLAGLIGVDTPGPLISFLPILLTGILFGLAMDYQVFLVSRMREDYVHGDTAQQATLNGMGHGARVVTAAAIIMASVFGGFVLIDDPVIKSIGFALAIGVLIDAFVVRMTLVPAVMSLLGDRAWYLPAWLGRVLPNVDIEGESLRRHLDGREPAPSGVVRVD